jgi:hypothetical protein
MTESVLVSFDELNNRQDALITALLLVSFAPISLLMLVESKQRGRASLPASSFPLSLSDITANSTSFKETSTRCMRMGANLSF